MHRFLLPIFVSLSLLVLAGCGDKNVDPLARGCEVERTEVEEISFCLPTGWSLITQSFGEEDSFIILLQDDAGGGTAMQIHVKKDVLQEPVSDYRVFSERAVEIARDAAPEYAVVSTDLITIDRKETLLHIFKAQPEGEEEPIDYYQFVTVHEGFAYGFTGVMFPGVGDELKEVLVDVFTNIRFV